MLKLKIIFVISTLCFIVITQSAIAQPSIKNNELNNFVFTWDNDVLYYTDYYYSQGLSFELTHQKLNSNPINYLLISLGENSGKHYSISIRQDMFTPTEIRDSLIRLDDRPYAGLLYLRSEKTSIIKEKQIQLKSSLDIGVRGPWSGAQQVQFYYHSIGDILLPQGWQYQMSNYPMVNYNISLQKQIWEIPKRLEIQLYSTMRIGTIYDDVLGGAFIKFGCFDSYFSSTQNKDFEAFGYFASDIKFVAYNGTMQGSLHDNPNPHEIKQPDIENIVATARMGLGLRYKRFGVNFSWIFLSPEFYGGLNHKYNSLNLYYLF